MHTVSQVLRARNLVSCGSHETVYQAAAIMTEACVGALVVLDAERLAGIFSERDLMTRVLMRGRDPHTTPVGVVMTREVVTAALGDRRSSCVTKMRETGCRHLPVLADGRVIGMLSMRDLLRDEIREQGQEIESLRAYLHQAPLGP